MQLRPGEWLDVERELCRRSLPHFARRAWRILEPSTDLKWGWVLDSICAHLQAVTDGYITRLAMNVPPGTMKSLLTSVIWNAWEWGPRGMPWLRTLNTSYSQNLAVRDAMKMRRLVTSEWYQRLWPIGLREDQNAKSKFENEETGFREAMAFNSMTGSRGDRVIIDDPISVANANSEAALREAELNFLEALPTRVNNDRSAIVVIMQRLHEKDTTGLILEKGLPYTHLCLPMRFEVDRWCYTPYYHDPRTTEGELLFPERFSEAQVAELERTLGAYGTAGQLQQRPTPRGGGLFKRHWFNVVQAAPLGTRWVRAWDLAATEDITAAWTAGVLIGRTPEGRFIVGNVVRLQGSPAAVEKLILNTAKLDAQMYRGVKGSLPQDPGQAGKVQVAYLTKQLAGFVYTSSPETGDKITRALPFAAQAEAGNVDLLAGPWNAAYLDELTTFPMAKFKDQVDATSRGFGELVNGSSYSLANV